MHKNAGEGNSSAKLTEDDVYEIRDRYAEGGCTHATLAQEFGVTRTTIWHILTRRTWRHLPELPS